MEQIFRVTTSVARNKGTVRYGTAFRAHRIWMANRNQPDNTVTVEVMTGEFRDVTAEWEAGNYASTQEPVEAVTEVVVQEESSGSGNTSDTVSTSAVSGLGWPE